MNVVPCGGNEYAPLLGCGPAPLWDEDPELGVDPPFAPCDEEADEAGVEDTACPELPDEALVA
jgi:hypothetical protein